MFRTLSTIALALAVLGTSAATVVAQEVSEAAVKTEVRRAWDSYITAFSAARTDVVANDSYAAPSYQLGPESANVRMTAGEVKTGFDATHRALAPERYDRTETDVAEICVLNRGAALLTARFTRYRTDDTVIMKGASAYLFGRFDDAWRIVAIIGNPDAKLVACD